MRSGHCGSHKSGPASEEYQKRTGVHKRQCQTAESDLMELFRGGGAGPGGGKVLYFVHHCGGSSGIHGTDPQGSKKCDRRGCSHQRRK